MSQPLNIAGSREAQSQENHFLSFADVFDEYQRPIYNYLLRMTQNQAEAEDLTQETFIRVYRGLPAFRGEAIGAEYKGRKAGMLGDVAVFAFYPNKQMTTGEGGMIVTGDEGWANLFRSLRNQGRDVFDAWLNHTRLGYNYRLGEMSAALGLAQLERIEELLAKRERVAQMYNQRLCEVDGVVVPYVAPTTTRMSWFVYVIRLAPEIDRNRVMAELKERGVPSRPYFTPIHLQPFYRERFGYQEGDFPITESIAKSTLALPFYGNLGEREVDFICGTLYEIINQIL